MNEKIIEEYINYIGIVKKIIDIPFIKNKKLNRKLLGQIQFLVEDRILYRYKLNKPPYTGYMQIIDEYDEKLINDFFEEKKKYMESIKDYNEIYEKINDIKNYFLNLINNKHTIYKNIYDDKDIKIKVKENFLKFRDISIPLDYRLKILLDMMGKKKFLRMILRYMGYGITGQHCSLPSNIYQYLYNEFNIRGEGFSSPLNSKLLGKKDTVFCTLFRDTDKFIGSLGPFSAKILIKNQHINWTINPPYIPSVIMLTYKNIIKAFKKIKRNDLLYIVLIPKWESDKGYQKFVKCKYLLKLIEPIINTHYMNCNGRTDYMAKVINSMFFLGRDKNIINEEKIEKIKEIWNTYTNDNTSQSLFTTDKL